MAQNNIPPEWQDSDGEPHHAVFAQLAQQYKLVRAGLITTPSSWYKEMMTNPVIVEIVENIIEREERKEAE